MAEPEYVNLKDVQDQIMGQMGVKTIEEAVARLEDALRRSDGKAKETYEIFLVLMRAEPDEDGLYRVA